MKTYRKTLFFLGMILLGAVLVTACAASPTPVALTGADKDNVLVFSEPSTDNILAAYNANDYKSFARDFDDAMLKALPESAFPNLVSANMDKYGKYTSRQVTAVEQIGEYYRVTYTGVFEKDSKVTILISFDKASPNRVAGLYFLKR